MGDAMREQFRRWGLGPVMGAFSLALLLSLTLADPSAYAAVPTRVTLTLSPAVAPPGQAVSMRGTVRPHLKREVRLQRRAGAGWKTIANGSTNRQGGYTFTPVAGPAGGSFRVLAPRSRRSGTVYASAVSP